MPHSDIEEQNQEDKDTDAKLAKLNKLIHEMLIKECVKQEMKRNITKKSTQMKIKKQLESLTLAQLINKTVNNEVAAEGDDPAQNSTAGVKQIS